MKLPGEFWAMFWMGFVIGAVLATSITLAVS